MKAVKLKGLISTAGIFEISADDHQEHHPELLDAPDDAKLAPE